MPKERSPLADASSTGRLYWVGAAATVAVVVALGVLEQLGIPNRYLGYAFVGLAVLLYAGVAALARSNVVGAYSLGGSTFSAPREGMSIASEWISAAAFIGLGGSLFLFGFDGLAFLLGIVGGLVLMAVLVAPALHRYDASTIPDFFAHRYEGKAPGLLISLILICCSFFYLVAQLSAGALIASRFLDLDFTWSIVLSLLAVLASSYLGGMRQDAKARVAIYLVVLAAYLIPLVIVSAKRYGIPLPHLTYGMALTDVAALEQGLIQKRLVDVRYFKAHATPFTGIDLIGFLGVVLGLMAGAAVMPHHLTRHFTASTGNEVRASLAWGLLFVCILVLAAPALAAFGRLELLSWINKGVQAGQLPEWAFSLGRLGLFKVCGVDAFDAATVTAACSKVGAAAGALRLQDIDIHRDILVFAMPEISGLASVFAGLVALGGLLAILATSDGPLLSIAGTLSHDIYFKVINPNAPTAQRLVISRAILILVAAVAAYVAWSKPSDIMTVATWAFVLAASGVFPALVLGLWWKRTNAWGCMAGMLVGFGVCLYYIIAARYFPVHLAEAWAGLSNAPPSAFRKLAELKQAWAVAPAGSAKDAAWMAIEQQARTMAGWWGLRSISAALVSMPLGLITMIVVSLVTPRPSAAVVAAIDRARMPDGPAATPM